MAPDDPTLAQLVRHLAEPSSVADSDGIVFWLEIFDATLDGGWSGPITEAA